MNIFKLQRKELKIMENNLLNNDIKPILKWVGGKRELIPIIREYYKNLSPKKYIEPFFGGGSVYLDVLKTFGIEFSKKSIINDVNTDLINLYKDIKTNPKGIEENCFELEDLFKTNDFYFIRDRFNGINREGEVVEKYDGIKRSSSLLLINRTCFNGLYRTNSKGLFNVPVGSYKNPKILDTDNLYKLSNVLPNIENIRNIQFDEINEIEKGDFVYFDPPYHPLTETSSFTTYSGTFGSKEQIRLRDYFKKLDDKGVYVILSNSSSPFIYDLYKDYKIVEVPCKRNINSKGEKRGKILEYLIIGNTLTNS
jgi:DNA adenine methylase